jgi:hypothetical protein
MNKPNMKNFIKLLALPLVLFAVLAPTSALAATTLNTDARDYATLRVNNDTVNPNNPNTWSGSISANPGNEASFAIYYHNTGTETARNVRITLTPQNSGSKTVHTFTATVRADNANTVTGSATITLSSAQPINYDSGTVIWRPNQTTFGSQALPNGQSGSQIFSGGINIGDVAPGWSSQGSVVVGYSIPQAQVQQLPTVTISANPSSITQGNASTLSWSSTNADSCYASGGWSGTKNLSGSQVVYPANTTTYTINCSNEAGMTSRSATVYVNQQEQDLPTLSLTANPSTVTSGNRSTLNWSSNNADTCVASNGWSGTKNLSGSQNVYPTYTTTYTIRCSNERGEVSQSVTVYVNEQQNNINVSLSANPNNINSGQASTLYWSSDNANNCYASDGWSGSKNLSGNQVVYPYTTTTYTIRCTNNTETESRSVTVYVNNNNNYQTPTVNIYASPRTILSGQSSILYWNTTNANNCYASGGWSGSKSVSGSQVVYPTSNTTYTLNCSNNNASQSGSDTVFVNQQQPNTALSVSCVATPVDPRVGDQVTFAAGAAGGVRPYYYEWSGDINSSEQIYNRSFSTTGTRVAQLTVRDAQGNQGTASCSISVRTKSTYIPPYKPPVYVPPVVVVPHPKVCKYVEACSVDGGKTYKIERDLSAAECNPNQFNQPITDNSNNQQPQVSNNNNQDHSLLASLFVTQSGNLSLIGVMVMFLFMLLMVLGIVLLALQIRSKNTN